MTGPDTYEQTITNWVLNKDQSLASIMIKKVKGKFLDTNRSIRNARLFVYFAPYFNDADGNGVPDDEVGSVSFDNAESCQRISKVLPMLSLPPEP